METDMPEHKQTGFLQRGGAWVVTQLLLMGAVVAGGLLWPGHWPIEAWWRGAAIASVAIGAVFLVGGLVALGRRLTIFPEPLPKSVLVRTGIYSVVRHPLYTSVVFCSLAWALWWQSLAALAAWSATTLFLDAKARHEERRLRKVFPEYRDYAARVKRLVPWVY